MTALGLRAQLGQNWLTRRGHLSRRSADPDAPAAARPSAPGPHRQLRRDLFEQLLSDVDARGSAGLAAGPAIRDRVRRVLDRALDREDAPALSLSEREELETELVAEATGLGPLSRLFTDATVSDILVNGPHDVFVDRYGRLEKTPVRFDSDKHLLGFITRLVAAHDRHIDAASPYVDVRLGDGSRLHAVVPPLAAAPVLCIRRMRPIPFTIDQLCAAGTLSREVADFLIHSVRSGANIVISGGVGSGKTTLLNVLAGFIPHEARIVTIEETAELRLPHPHVVTLESRLANIEGRGEVTLRTLVRNALRMRADRLIVGEVRGAEVFDMLQAMNTGHEGSLTTVHANSTADALRRLESLVLLAGFPLPSSAIRELLAATIQVVVQLRRQPDGPRRVVAIDRVGFSGDTLATTTIFAFEGGRHVAIGRSSNEQEGSRLG